MEATREQWEENEEVGMDLRGRPPRQNINTITSGEDVVHSSQSSSEAESLNAEEEEEAKGSPRNGFRMVSDKNGGAESSYTSGFIGGEVEYLISEKISGSEIVASEVETLSFQKSVEAKRQDDDYIKLKDEELPGFGALPSTQSIQQTESYASLENGKAEHGKVKLRDISEQEVSELYLERVYEKPAAHEFYCPNCNSCITKVLIREKELENRPETIRCTSCFSFLIPAGNWFRPKAEPKIVDHPTVRDKAPEPYLKSRVGVELPVSPQDSNGTFNAQNPPIGAHSVGVSEPLLIDKAPVPGDSVEASINGVQVPVPSYDSSGTLHDQKSPLPGQSVVSITVTTQPSAPVIDDAGPAETKPRESTTVIIRSGGPTIISEPSDAKTFEILKSIVYGGLTEAIASLSIVTSAASAGAATLNILALALANLLGGLFIIGHHLWELKVDQSRVTSGETDEQVDRYAEVLGKRENFFLHASVAILSFLIFGLVPPLVYCFSFRQSNDTDLKLAVVAASSLLCIILLSTGKAYIQRPQKYIKTLLYYIIIGVGAAGVSYLAGDLIDKLIEKLGWFNSTVSGTLPVPQMSIVKPAWKSW